MLSNLDLTKVACPRCSKKYFKETGEAGVGSFYDVFSDLFMNDLVYRKPAEKLYKDGVLQNPEAFTPEPTKQYFKCLDCGCNFYVKTSYEFVGGDIAYVPSYETFDADKEKEEREVAWKKQCEERKKEEERKKAEEEKQKAEDFEKYKAEHPGEFLTINKNIDPISATISVDQSISESIAEIKAMIEKLEDRVRRLETWG